MDSLTDLSVTLYPTGPKILCPDLILWSLQINSGRCMKCGSERTAMTLDEIPGRWTYRAVQKRAEARQREIMMECGK